MYKFRIHIIVWGVALWAILAQLATIASHIFPDALPHISWLTPNMLWGFHAFLVHFDNFYGINPPKDEQL